MSTNMHRININLYTDMHSMHVHRHIYTDMHSMDIHRYTDLNRMNIHM
jgi:hypothetical protein